ncbi:MAG: haloacid dehalogenase [Verrucomicrobiales bacterium]|nr:haloacid dehalogenase [Verrucomicrobiales bacterium]
MPKTIIFDFDGLILDTEVAVYESWADNYRAFGHDLPLDIYVQCVGSDFGTFDPKSHLESLTEESVDWEHWDERRSQIALERTHQLAPFAGVLELLLSASEIGIPCVVASSSPREWVEGHLGRLGLLEHFTATRCIDDVEAPKPAPDLFLAAAEVTGIPPADAIVLEDSRNGLLASQAAGIPCVVVPNRITEKLNFDGAAAILSSLEGVQVEHLIEIHQRSR